VERRAEALGLTHVFTGIDDKLAVLRGVCQTLGIPLSEAAHVGDDVNDLPSMNAVGCPLSVADALEPVRVAAVYVSPRRGGDAAVRDICDRIVAARAV